MWQEVLLMQRSDPSRDISRDGRILILCLGGARNPKGGTQIIRSTVSAMLDVWKEFL
jgi:hypothetical protein